MIEIFTDGSFDKVRQCGGWAFVAYAGDREISQDSGGASGESNNTFEVLAVLQAVKWAKTELPTSPITIWTDSFYVMEGINRCLPIWRNNGWKRIDPNPRRRKRASQDSKVWQALDVELSKAPPIKFEWCKAHRGQAGNERADKLAGAGRAAEIQAHAK